MSTLPAPKEDTPVQPPEHASVPLKESQHDEPPVLTGVSLHETSPRTNLDSLVGGDTVSRDPDSQGNDPRSPTSRIRACGCAKGGRNLVVCIDGTSNQFGETNTNVIELYGLIPKDTNDKQRTYYNSGIGTYARPSWKSWAYYKQSVAHKIDLAIAWNFERILLDAYRWLSETYEDGDCIFLFGFSRGAYQVRTLSAMIDKVGLIHRGNEQQIPFAYQLYADFGSSRANTREAGIFKKTFSRRNVKVHFVGAWDTVSSIGMVRSRKPLPGTVEGMKHVCLFRHALALDERRVKFLPEYACGGAGPSPRSVESNHTKEVWFAGTHSDVGGGNVGNLALSNTRPALRWMFSEASAAGLRLDPFERDFQDEEVIGIIESLTIPWKPFEYIPLRRLAYVTATEGWEAGIGALWADCTISWPPHRGKGRVIQDGQKIHTSVWRTKDLDAADITQADVPNAPVHAASIRAVISRLFIRHQTKLEYIPRAHRPQDIGFWSNIRKPNGPQEAFEASVGQEVSQKNVDAWKAWKEVDLYDSVTDLIKEYTAHQSTDSDDDVQRTQLAMMHIHANSLSGRHALLRELSTRLKEGPRVQGAILCNILGVIVTASVSQSPPGIFIEARCSDLLPNVLRHLDDSGPVEVQRSMMQRFVKELVDSLERVKDFVQQYTDNQPVESSDLAQRIQLATMRVIVNSVDGRRKLMTELSKRLKEPHIVRVDNLTGLLDILADSANDQEKVKVDLPYRFVRSQMLRHLDTADASRRYLAQQVLQRCAKITRTVEVMTDRTHAVSSVAFSPEGNRVVSASYDGGIQIRDAETGQAMGKPFEEHTGIIRSVAFSPDGKRIVSGSDDNTIRIWDANTGQTIGKPIEGHAGHVTSVAFSPDGKRIVSSSRDKTICVWDAETGRSVGQALEGHTDAVRSVALSPDGMRIASGSHDKTIRIWDAETGQVVGEPLLGHSDWVLSVAISPDGKRIVSGSSDETIRIWDAETGQAVGKPLEGHTDRVWSVAFSPNGKRIVSGSGDETIRIWDAETRQVVGEPLLGHSDWVLSVAFSPDGTRIISGSFDTTARIWDVLLEHM